MNRKQKIVDNSDDVHDEIIPTLSYVYLLEIPVPKGSKKYINMEKPLDYITDLINI